MIVALTLALAILTQDPNAARAIGDQILSAGQAEGVFRNVSDGDVVRLKHTASGLTCQFDATASRNNVRIFPVRPGIESPGDDVSCGTTPDIAYSTYATRYRPESSEAAAMAQAIQEVEAFWGDLRRLEIGAPAGTPQGGFAVFKGRHPNGQPLATVILVRQIGPWTFKMRASGPQDEPENLVRLAAERFAAQLPQTSVGSQ